MIINDLDDFMLVKYMLRKEFVLQKDLISELNKRLGKDTKASNFSCKLRREHLTYKELRIICDILGYDISITKRTENTV